MSAPKLVQTRAYGTVLKVDNDTAKTVNRNLGVLLEGATPVTATIEEIDPVNLSHVIRGLDTDDLRLQGEKIEAVKRRESRLRKS